MSVKYEIRTGVSMDEHQKMLRTYVPDECLPEEKLIGYTATFEMVWLWV